MNLYEKVGYYLIEKTSIPMKNIPLLTASDCICNIHPQSDIFLHSKDSKYFERLGLTVNEKSEFVKDIEILRDKNKITSDRRFAEIDDARRIYNKYLKKISDMQLISISVEKSYIPILREEMEEEFLISKDSEKGEKIGYDILGWDIASFHSYICNALDDMINKKYTIEYNEFGVISNSYEEVKEFVRFIEGEGEQVEWLPFKVDQYRL